ncbi:MAG: hypothetical protein QM688_13110 [Sphingomonas bacterium]
MTQPRGIWLAAPTRFAALSRRNARIALALAAALLLACFTALTAPGPARLTDIATEAGEDHLPQRMLLENIVADMRYGSDYYTAAATELRRSNDPLKPFLAFRMPTLAVMQAALPDGAAIALLFLLGAGAAAAWYARLGAAFIGWQPRAFAAIMALGGLASFARIDLIAFPEIWAAPLIALSLAVWRTKDVTAAIAIGLCAMLIRESAVLYCAIMAAAALIEGRRREFVGWAAAILVFLLALGFHAHAVSLVVRPLDGFTAGWPGMLGFGFFVRMAAQASAFAQLPMWLAAPLTGLSLIGWAAWRDPLGGRVFAILAGYALLLAFICQADSCYWALIAAPVMAIGLVFAPDALRELVARALDRRRITVTRVVR